MSKNKEEIAKEYAVRVYPTANDVDAGLGCRMQFNAAEHGFLNGAIWMESLKNKETEKLIEALTALITALDMVAHSDTISVGVDEIEELVQCALGALKKEDRL